MFSRASLFAFGVGVLAAAAPSLTACQTGAEPTADGANALTPRDAAPIPFEACPILTWPPSDDRSAECATIDVPLDWDAPAGRRASFFVKRVRGSAPGLHKQIWLLQGGPGGAGDSLESFARILVGRDPTVDVYVPDHRGTGRSTYLDCPEAAASPKGFDAEACGPELVRIWGDGLKTFTTTTAARDVGTTIERTREPGQEVHVYGVSYGTYLAQRYLQLYPSQATSVTLDGVCQSGLCSLHKFGYWQDRVGKKLLRDCAADALCAEKLGADPAAKVKEAIARAPSCAAFAGLPSQMVRSVLANFVTSISTRTLIPAIAYRTLRCNDSDVVVLKNLVKVLTGGDEAKPTDPSAEQPPMLFSPALLYHVALSEMESDPIPTAAELQELLADAVFTAYDPWFTTAYNAWPRYPRDEFVGRYPTTTTPVLLLNGTLDAQTPVEFAEEVARHYTAPNQKLFVLPRASHGTVLGASPMVGGGQCGRGIWDQFVKNPRATLDASCGERILPMDFSTSPLAGMFFATDDLFEGVPAPTPPPRRTAEGERTLAELRAAMAFPRFGVGRR